jgi:hypothetical protein
MGGLFLLNNGTFEVLRVFNGEKRMQARTSFHFWDILLVRGILLRKRTSPKLANELHFMR